MRLAYLLLIMVSNLLTATFDPFVLADGVLIVPVGSVLIGALFVLRDLIQIRRGRSATYRLIVWATILSMALSCALGDPMHVAWASLAAFTASEIIDTEIFTRTRHTLATRVLLSGVAGGTIDSTVFVVIGLSPLGANALPWGLVPAAILGQVIAKLLLQLAAAVWLVLRHPERKAKT